MLGFELLRNKWVLLALFGGIAMIFYVTLFYFDHRKPRRKKESSSEEYETEYMSAWQAIPWSLKVTIFIILVFAIVYTIHALNNPVNW